MQPPSDHRWMRLPSGLYYCDGCNTTCRYTYTITVSCQELAEERDARLRDGRGRHNRRRAKHHPGVLP